MDKKADENNGIDSVGFSLTSLQLKKAGLLRRKRRTLQSLNDSRLEPITEHSPRRNVTIHEGFGFTTPREVNPFANLSFIKKEPYDPEPANVSWLPPCGDVTTPSIKQELQEEGAVVSTPPSVLRTRLQMAESVRDYLKQEITELCEFTTNERQMLAVEGLPEVLQENLALKSNLEVVASKVDVFQNTIVTLQGQVENYEKDIQLILEENQNMKGELQTLKEKCSDEAIQEIERTIAFKDKRIDELEVALTNCNVHKSSMADISSPDLSSVVELNSIIEILKAENLEKKNVVDIQLIEIENLKSDYTNKVKELTETIDVLQNRLIEIAKDGAAVTETATVECSNLIDISIRNASFRTPSKPRDLLNITPDQFSNDVLTQNEDLIEQLREEINNLKVSKMKEKEETDLLINGLLTEMDLLTEFIVGGGNGSAGKKEHELSMKFAKNKELIHTLHEEIRHLKGLNELKFEEKKEADCLIEKLQQELNKLKSDIVQSENKFAEKEEITLKEQSELTNKMTQNEELTQQLMKEIDILKDLSTSKTKEKEEADSLIKQLQEEIEKLKGDIMLSENKLAEKEEITLKEQSELTNKMTQNEELTQQLMKEIDILKDLSTSKTKEKEEADSLIKQLQEEIEKLKGDIMLSENKLAEKEEITLKEQSELTNKMTQNEELTQQLMKEIDILKDLSTSKTKEKEEADSLIKQLQEEIEKLKGDIMLSENKLAEKEEITLKEQSELTNKMTQNEELTQQLMKEIDILKDLSTSKTKEKEEADSLIKQLQEEIEKLKGDIMLSENKLAEKEEITLKEQSELTNKMTQNEELTQQLMKEIDILKDLSTSKTKEKEEADSLIKQLQEEIEKLKGDIMLSENKLAEKEEITLKEQSELTNKMTQNEELTQQLMKEIDILKDLSTSKTKEKEEADSLIKQLQEEIEKLKGDIMLSENKLTEKEEITLKEQSELTNKMTQNEELTQQLMKEIDTLKDLSTSKTKEKEEADSLIKQLQEEIEKLKGDIMLSENKLAEKEEITLKEQSELTNKMTQNEELTQQLMKEMDTLKDLSILKTKEKEEADSLIKQLQEEIEKLKGDIVQEESILSQKGEAISKENLELSRKLMQSEDLILTLQKEVDGLKDSKTKENEDADESIKELQQSIEILRNEMERQLVEKEETILNAQAALSGMMAQNEYLIKHHEKEITSLKESSSSQMKEKQEVGNFIMELQEEKEKLKNDVEQINKLWEENNEKTLKEHFDLSEKLVQNEDLIRHLYEEISCLKDVNSQNLKELEETGLIIKNLEREIEQLNDKSKQAEIHLMEKEELSVKKENLELVGEMIQNRDLIQQLHEEIKSLRDLSRLNIVEKEEAESFIKELQQKNEILEKSLIEKGEMALKELIEISDKLVQSEELVQHLQKEIYTLKELSSSNTKERDEMNNFVKDIQQENEKLKYNVEQTGKYLVEKEEITSKEHLELTNKLTRNEDLIHQLQREVDSLKEINSLKIIEKVRADNLIKDLQQEIKELQYGKELKDKKIAEKEEVILKVQTEVFRMLEQNESLIQHHQKELDNLNSLKIKEIEKCHMEIEECHVAIKDLQEKIEKLVGDVIQAEKILTEKGEMSMKENSVLSTKLTEKEEIIQHLHEEIKNLNELNSLKIKEKEETDHFIKQLQIELGGLRIEEECNLKESLNESRKSIQNELMVQQIYEQINSLKEEKSMKLREQEEVDNCIIELKAEIGKLKSDIRNAESNLKETKDKTVQEHLELSRKLEQNEDLIQHLREEITSLRDRNGLKIKELEETEAVIQDLRREVEKLKGEIKEAEIVMEKKVEEINSLKIGEKEGAERLIKELQQENEKLRVEIEQTGRHLAENEEIAMKGHIELSDKFLQNEKLILHLQEEVVTLNDFSSLKSKEKEEADHFIKELQIEIERLKSNYRELTRTNIREKEEADYSITELEKEIHKLKQGVSKRETTVVVEEGGDSKKVEVWATNKIGFEGGIEFSEGLKVDFCIPEDFKVKSGSCQNLLDRINELKEQLLKSNSALHIVESKYIENLNQVHLDEVNTIRKNKELVISIQQLRNDLICYKKLLESKEVENRELKLDYEMKTEQQNDQIRELKSHIMKLEENAVDSKTIQEVLDDIKELKIELIEWNEKAKLNLLESENSKEFMKSDIGELYSNGNTSITHINENCPNYSTLPNVLYQMKLLKKELTEYCKTKGDLKVKDFENFMTIICEQGNLIQELKVCLEEQKNTIIMDEELIELKDDLINSIIGARNWELEEKENFIIDLKMFLEQLKETDFEYVNALEAKLQQNHFQSTAYTYLEETLKKLEDDVLDCQKIIKCKNYQMEDSELARTFKMDVSVLKELKTKVFELQETSGVDFSILQEIRADVTKLEEEFLNCNQQINNKNLVELEKLKTVNEAQSLQNDKLLEELRVKIITLELELQNFRDRYENINKELVLCQQSLIEKSYKLSKFEEGFEEKGTIILIRDAFIDLRMHISSQMIPAVGSSDSAMNNLVQKVNNLERKTIQLLQELDSIKKQGVLRKHDEVDCHREISSKTLSNIDSPANRSSRLAPEFVDLNTLEVTVMNESLLDMVYEKSIVASRFDGLYNDSMMNQEDPLMSESLESSLNPNISYFPDYSVDNQSIDASKGNIEMDTSKSYFQSGDSACNDLRQVLEGSDLQYCKCFIQHLLMKVSNLLGLSVPQESANFYVEIYLEIFSKLESLTSENLRVKEIILECLDNCSLEEALISLATSVCEKIVEQRLMIDNLTKYTEDLKGEVRSTILKNVVDIKDSQYIIKTNALEIVDDFTRSMSVIHQEFTMLKDQIILHNVEKESTIDEVSNLHSINLCLTKELEIISKDYEESKVQLDLYNNISVKYDELLGEHEQKKNENAELTNTYKNLKDKLETLVEEYKECKHKIDQYNQIEVEFENLKSDFKSIGDICNQLKVENQEYKIKTDQLSDLTQVNNELKEKLSQSNNSYQALKEELGGVIEEYKEYKLVADQYSEIRTELENIKTAFEVAEQKCNLLKQENLEYESKIHELSNLNVVNENVLKENETLKTDLKDMKEKYNVSVQDNQNYVEKLKEMFSLSQMNESLKSEIENINMKYEDCKSQLDQFKEEHVNLKLEHHKVEVRFEDLKDKYEKLQCLYEENLEEIKKAHSHYESIINNYVEEIELVGVLLECNITGKTIDSAYWEQLKAKLKVLKSKLQIQNTFENQLQELEVQISNFKSELKSWDSFKTCITEELSILNPIENACDLMKLPSLQLLSKLVQTINSRETKLKDDLEAKFESFVAASKIEKNKLELELKKKEELVNTLLEQKNNLITELKVETAHSNNCREENNKLSACFKKLDKVLNSTNIPISESQSLCDTENVSCSNVLDYDALCTKIISLKEERMQIISTLKTCEQKYLKISENVCSTIGKLRNDKKQILSTAEKMKEEMSVPFQVLKNSFERLLEIYYSEKKTFLENSKLVDMLQSTNNSLIDNCKRMEADIQIKANIAEESKRLMVDYSSLKEENLKLQNTLHELNRQPSKDSTDLESMNSLKLKAYDTEIKSLLDVLGCERELVNDNSVWDKIREEINILRNEIFKKKTSTHDSNEYLEEKIRKLESEVLNTELFKRTYAKEINSLDPDSKIFDLVNLPLVELHNKMISTIMDKEHKLMADLENRYETKIASNLDKIKQLEVQEAKAKLWVLEIEAENEKLNKDCKQLIEDNKALKMKVESVHNLMLVNSQDSVEVKKDDMSVEEEYLMTKNEEKLLKLSISEMKTFSFHDVEENVRDEAVAEKIEILTEEMKQRLSCLENENQILLKDLSDNKLKIQELEAVQKEVQIKELKIKELEAVQKIVQIKELKIKELEAVQKEVQIKELKIKELEAVQKEVQIKELKIKELEAVQKEVQIKELKIKELEAVQKEVQIKELKIKELEAVQKEVQIKELKIKELEAVQKEVQIKELKIKELEAVQKEVLDKELKIKELKIEVQNLGVLKEKSMLSGILEIKLQSCEGRIKELTREMECAMNEFRKERQLLAQNIQCKALIINKLETKFKEVVSKLNIESPDFCIPENEYTLNQNKIQEIIESKLKFIDTLIAKIECEIDMFLSEKKKFEGVINLKDEQICDVKEKLHKMNVAFLEEKNRLEEAISSKLSIINELKKTLAAKNDFFESLQQQVKDLINDKSKLENDLQGKISIIDNLKKQTHCQEMLFRSEKKKLEDAYNHQMVNIESFERSQKESASSLTKLEGILKTKILIINEQNESLEKMEKKFCSEKSMWEESLNSKVNTIKDLELQIKISKSKFNLALNSKTEMIESLENRLQESSHTVKKLEDKVNELNEKMNQDKDMYEMLLKKNAAEIKKIGNNLDQMNLKNVEDIGVHMLHQRLYALFAEAPSSIDDALQCIGERFCELEELREKVKALDEENEEMNNFIQNLENQIGTLCKLHSSEVEKLNNLLCEKNDEYQKLSTVNAHLLEKENTLEKELSTKIHELKQREELLQRLQGSPSKIEAEKRGDQKGKIRQSCHSSPVPTSPVPECLCKELGKEVQSLRLGIVERNTKITQLEMQIHSGSLPFQQKAELVDEYKQKILDLRNETRRLKEQLQEGCSRCHAKSHVRNMEVSVQCDTSTGSHSETLESQIPQLKERLRKLEKEKLILKKLCHKRADTIEELRQRIGVRAPM